MHMHAQIPLLGHLGAECEGAIIAELVMHRHDKNHEVYHAGDVGHDMFFIVK